MKKQNQNNKQRAAKQLQNWAATNEEPIQLTFPTADIAELAQSSLGDLLRAVGKLFIESVMEAEVEQVVGRRSKRNQERGAYRWGTEAGFCTIDGQRVPIARPRIRIGKTTERSHSAATNYSNAHRWSRKRFGTRSCTA